jgi:MFS family permease
LPQIVPQEALGNAVTWNSSGWQVSTVVGPAVGGYLIWQTGQAWGAYAVAAVGYCLGAMVISTLRPRPLVREPKSQASSLDDLLAGLRFVWNTPLILATITMDLFAVLLGGATVLLPVYAKDILHIEAAGLGWLRAAPSVGALAMALVMAHRPPLKRAGPTLLMSVAGFGVATIAFGLSTDPVLSFIVLAATGALDNVSIVVRGTLVQLLTPDAMRGRVSAVNTIFIVSSNELGAFESGMTAAWFGPVASVVGGGIGTLLVVGWVMLKWPQVARLGPLDNPTGQLYTESAEEEIVEERT